MFIKKFLTITLISGSFLFISPVFADSLKEENELLKEKLDITIQMLQKLQKQYDEMKKKVDILYGTVVMEDSSEEEELIDSSVQSLSSGNQTGIQSTNPNIMLAGTFTGAVIDNPQDDPDLRDRFRMQETELAFQASIDPYSKAFFNISVNRDEAVLEEGYLELNNLPHGVTAKFGRFRTNFGKINKYHMHDLPQVDYPLVLRNFFGDEGYTDEGIGITYNLPTPWFSRLEFNVLNGENEGMFNLTALEPSGVARYSNLLSVTDNTQVELGFSGAFGVNNDRGDHFSFVEGVDLTYQWKPLDKPYKSFKWQTEGYLAQREQPNNSYHNNFGMYSFIEYQLSRRWHSGFRVDYSDVLDTNGRAWAVSPYFRFQQSETSKWKLQFTHNQRDHMRDSNAVFLQWIGFIGTHKH